MLAAFLFLLCMLAPQTALAHENGLLTPSDWWTHWNWNLFILAGMALMIWLYARGVQTLWQRAGHGRGVRRWQAAAFAGGVLALFIALVSPLDALSGTLFSAHMVQHLVLMLAAAPLLVLAAPLVPMLWGVPKRWRRSIAGLGHVRFLRCSWDVLSQPLVAWVLHAGMMWLWHLPGPYQIALENELIHAVEHFSFLGSGLLYWWTLFYLGKSGYGLGVLSLFGMMMQSGLLAVLITFSPTPWYPDYAAKVAPWGLTLLEDQQLAGLSMWIPAGVVYLVAAGALFSVWMQAMEQRAALRESRLSRRPTNETHEVVEADVV